MKPVVYGKVSVSRRIGGVRARTAWRRRVVARREQLQELGLGEVGGGPLGHQQDRVALVDRLPGQQLVALVEDLVDVLEDRRVLVLERVVVLVREVEAFGRPGCPLLETTYSLPSSLR